MSSNFFLPDLENKMNLILFFFKTNCTALLAPPSPKTIAFCLFPIIGIKLFSNP